MGVQQPRERPIADVSGESRVGRSRMPRWKKIVLSAAGAFVLLLLAGLVGSIVDPLPPSSTKVDTPAGRPPRSTTPNIPPATSALTPPRAAASESSAQSTAAGTRGLLDSAAWWESHFKSAAPSECLAQGEQPIGTEHAWLLGNGAVACYDDQALTTWGGRVIGVDIYFSGKTTDQQALAVAAGILPTDLGAAAAFDGVNTSESRTPTGTCRQVVYDSAALADAVKSANPAWSADPRKANVTLYSGHASAADGSDSVYHPASIKLASVGIGAENRGGDGAVHC